MVNNKALDRTILMNHFSGNSTPLQKKLIEEWLGMPGNMEYYYYCLDEWENSNMQFLSDDELALKKVLAVKEEVGFVSETKPRIVFLSKRMTVAAAILLVIGTAYWFGKDEIIYKKLETTYGEVKQVTLPDGSLVTLNSNSSIQFSRFGFEDGKREVLLDGEADFSVMHTKNNQKFIVKTKNKLDVTVLGTQFSVYARDEKDKVALRKGKVLLEYLSKDNKTKNLILKPGDLFIGIVGGEDTLQHINDAEREVAWKTHAFLFEGTSLVEIARMLRDDFGINTRFQSQSLAARKISGSFHAEKAEELIDAIAQLLDINYKTKDNSVYFFE